MDRTLLVNLLQDGVLSPGKEGSRIWFLRRFDVVLKDGRLVIVDEYEGYDEEKNPSRNDRRHRIEPMDGKMFHVGQSVLHLKDQQIINKPGSGWQSLRRGVR